MAHRKRLVGALVLLTAAFLAGLLAAQADDKPIVGKPIIKPDKKKPGPKKDAARPAASCPWDSDITAA